MTKGIVLVHKAWNVVLGTGNVLINVAKVAFYGLTLQLGKAKTAMAALNTTTKANIFGLVAAGVALLAMKLWDMRKAADAAAQSQKALNAIKAEAQRQVVEEKLKLDNLVKAAKD